MNRLNTFLSLLFCLLFLSACLEETVAVPELPSSPSGGLSQVSVSAVNGSELSFCVDLFAIDHFGGFIENLDGNCFSYDNTDGSTLSFIGLEARRTPDKGPYSAQLLFDQSGSISSTDPTNARIDAGLAFVDIMSGRDEASVAVFTSGSSNYPSDLTRLTPFTVDKNILTDQIEAMRDRQGGGTPLYSSIYDLLLVIDGEANNGNRAIVVFTDGQDTDGGINIATLIQDANDLGIEVYTVGLGTGVEEDVLAAIALGTGGSVMYAQEVTQLVSLYSSLAELLRGGYDVYNICYTLNLPGRVWQSGDIYRVNISLMLPTGEVILYPIYLTVP
jgi:hypothetical protein